MRLIIVRHGETEENREGIFQGHLSGRLSVLGKEQAEKLSRRLKNEAIDYIYSSDLARAADTAEIIARNHPRAKLELTQRLRERDLGRFTGKKKTELQAADISAIDDDPSAESHDDLFKRAREFLYGLKQNHQNDTVVLVGHNGINKNLIAAITGKSVSDIPKQSNTSVNVFTILSDDKWIEEVSNCTDHLN